MKPFEFRYHKTVYPAIDPARSELSATGKTVLVTGGGKSIGKAITESFAIAGAKNIIILGRELSALNSVRDELATRYPSTKVYAYDADVEDTGRCREIFIDLKTNIAPIDVMVLNAAYLHTPQALESMDIDDFWKCFEINVKANTVLAQLFCNNCSQHNPTLIHVSSFLAWLGPFPFPCQGYSGSKAAFDLIIGYLGLQRPDLRVFTMHPGSVVTPMLVKVGADPNRDGYTDIMLPGAFAVYLASVRADFLRGKTLESNWDVEDMESQAEEIRKSVKYAEIEPAAPLTTGLVGRSLPPSPW